mmetsp:Transcript_20146/g.18299  ORF Transcript_20146/g.18299 Transcript_20146/m.18299 type:complete len:320 (+) Transcript_20146:89-1048(+)|eukprot:CAMPEP_0196765986 /NCGR_PEP_ID=MMETSP1095-20130614/16522_1 /TAXON_ID=96789 ORGANISM="Chromulina nebulosa, Strain UTEXLB2642" /NCGR_SAMPLE_ID=MMETSP1095 /ASSEMBLY_ACC=CAM_ASM_000446 /LENGTH=319 /DNA_ID=CAMNT_0042125627 /DNA_START=1 /DNA_END=960 /DNA_ORIENTATION=+
MFANIRYIVVHHYKFLGGITTAVSGIAYTLAESKEGRAYRLKRLLRQPLPELDIVSAPFIAKNPLYDDLCKEIVLITAGVKILWGIQGSGKSTTVRKAVNELLQSGKIAGAIMMTPPDEVQRSKITPAQWFRDRLADSLGRILRNEEKLSDLLPSSHPIDNFTRKPYVIIFDQMENEECDEVLRVFIKTMAEDSAIVKSYVVVLITADASKAKTTLLWNCKQKIVMLAGSDLMKYRWDANEIDDWIDKYAAKNSKVEGLEEGSHSRATFRKSAITAGTPGFLIYNVEKLATPSEELERSSLYYSKLWSAGEEQFSDNDK